MQNIKKLLIMLLIFATNIIGMESELKQRLLSNNPQDTHILIKEQTMEDCGICWEEKEVIQIPCEAGEKHPKLCASCLEGCESCPFCRRPLPKKRPLMESCLCGISFGCLVIYLGMIINSFS